MAEIDTKYYAPVEVAHVLGISKATLYGWLRDPSHPLVGIKVGSMWRIPQSNLKRYIEENNEQA